MVKAKTNNLSLKQDMKMNRTYPLALLILLARHFLYGCRHRRNLFCERA